MKKSEFRIRNSDSRIKNYQAEMPTLNVAV
jgi:hypothetical protein